MRAAQLRQTQSAEAKVAFQARMAAQTRRLDALRELQEQKARDVKEAARQKREYIEQTQRQMRAREAERRQAILTPSPAPAPSPSLRRVRVS